MRNRARLGDIFEIVTPVGLAYVQLINKDRSRGELIRVLDGSFSRRPQRIEDTTLLPDRFIVFYPVSVAIIQKGAIHVGHAEVPPHLRRFPRMLLPGLRDRSGTVMSWWLYDGQNSRPLPTLNDEHRKLPVGVTLLQQGLINAIVNDWKPTDEFEPGGAGLRKLLSRQPAPPVEPEIRGWLYFRRRIDAVAAKEVTLRQLKGTEAKVSLAEPGSWRLLVTSHGLSADVLDDALEAIARHHGGTYDGHEIALDVLETPTRTGS